MPTRWMYCAGMIAFALSAWAGSAVASDVDEPHVFDPAHRRDPFTFRQSIPTGPVIWDPVPVEPVFDPQATREEIRRHYDSAEQAFLDANWNSVLVSCARAIDVLRAVPMEERNKFSGEETAIFRLHTAADRMILREEAQNQFKALNIALTGVVARNASAQAIVNSKIVSRGTVVPVPNAPQDVVVLEIRANEVVFLYRGFRMTVEIKDGEK